MKPVDLTKTLKPYKSGWVALDNKHKVVAHEKDFESISKRVTERDDVTIMPASKNYSASLLNHGVSVHWSSDRKGTSCL